MECNSDISKDSIIEEILRDHPECKSVFDKHDMPCSSCMGASTGTIAEGAMMHDVDIENLLKELRTCVSDSHIR